MEALLSQAVSTVSPYLTLAQSYMDTAIAFASTYYDKFIVYVPAEYMTIAKSLTADEVAFVIVTVLPLLSLFFTLLGKVFNLCGLGVMKRAAIKVAPARSPPSKGGAPPARGGARPAPPSSGKKPPPASAAPTPGKGKGAPKPAAAASAKKPGRGGLSA